MKPSRRCTSGSSRFCFATAIVAASRRAKATLSFTSASESRNDSSAPRSAGACASIARTSSTCMRSDYKRPGQERSLRGRSEVGAEPRVETHVTGGGLRDAHTHLQRQIIADGQVADQLDTHRAQAMQPGRLARVPGIADVTEERQRDL